MTDLYARYTRLKFDRPHARVLRITMENGRMNTTDEALHRELAEIWRDVDRDESVNAAIITSAGLISLTVNDAELDGKAVEIAGRLAEGAQSAIRWTKYALNNWLRAMGPTFDASLALEMLGFGGPEVKEGLASHLEKRRPAFPPGSPL